MTHHALSYPIETVIFDPVLARMSAVNGNLWRLTSVLLNLGEFDPFSIQIRVEIVVVQEHLDLFDTVYIMAHA